MEKYFISLINKFFLAGVFICAVCACSIDRSAKGNFTDKEKYYHTNEIAALNCNNKKNNFQGRNNNGF